eukprot:8788322-Pyramimonas_sp.AAC.1
MHGIELARQGALEAADLAEESLERGPPSRERIPLLRQELALDALHVEDLDHEAVPLGRDLAEQLLGPSAQSESPVADERNDQLPALLEAMLAR